MKRFVAIALLLAGCATTAKYEASLDEWVGQRERWLVKSWGPPQSTYDAGDGVRYLTYTSDRTAILPGIPASYRTTVVGNTAYSTPYGGTPAQAVGFRCETTFELHHGTIKSWRIRGNDCRSN